MDCMECYKSFVDGEPYVALYVGREGRDQTRFTGIVWHVECSPREKDHLREEAAVVEEKGNDL